MFIFLTFTVKEYFESMDMILLVTSNPKSQSVSHQSYRILTGTLFARYFSSAAIWITSFTVRALARYSSAAIKMYSSEPLPHQ